MGREHDADHVHDHDHHDGIKGEFTSGVSTYDGEVTSRQLFVHDAESICPGITFLSELVHHRLKPKRYEQDGKKDNADTLD